ncbi:universal stress protein [Klenkia sp. LSe6-5]|uniref:Universal stress protein n=1 Tax=Klenkia sesuvii TaxID=3103137 RepID=A0ABU8DUP7_9ACTN
MHRRGQQGRVGRGLHVGQSRQFDGSGQLGLGQLGFGDHGFSSSRSTPTFRRWRRGRQGPETVACGTWVPGPGRVRRRSLRGRDEEGHVDGTAWSHPGPWLACGVSRSAASRAALRWALLEADRRDARLVAVRVWTGGSSAARSACERDLVATVSAAVHDTGVRGRTWVRLVDGDPHLVLAALSEEADLLVLGAHRTPAEG